MEQREGVHKSKIMLAVDLTSFQALTYLGKLMDQEFILHDKASNRYHTTPKGVQYLSAINNLMELLEERKAKTSLYNPPTKPTALAST